MMSLLIFSGLSDPAQGISFATTIDNAILHSSIAEVLDKLFGSEVRIFFSECMCVESMSCFNRTHARYSSKLPPSLQREACADKSCDVYCTCNVEQDIFGHKDRLCHGRRDVLRERRLRKFINGLEQGRGKLDIYFEYWSCESIDATVGHTHFIHIPIWSDNHKSRALHVAGRWAPCDHI